MRLSPHFTLNEFTRSMFAARHAIDNVPSPENIENMIALCQNVLEPVRARFGPIRITSGFRNAQVNKGIGGSTRSQHMTGQAADFESFTGKADNFEIAKWIESNVEFDQLILEMYNPAVGPTSGWVHASYRRDGTNRRSVLTASLINRKVVYTNGLVL